MGRPLVLCNVELLEELSERTVQIQHSLTSSSTSDPHAALLFRAIRENALALGAELRRVRSALGEESPEGAAGSFVEIVNQELLDYEKLVSGRPRLTCRPGMLARMKRTLGRAQESAARLPDSLAKDMRFRAVRESGLAQLRILDEETRNVIRARKTTPKAGMLSALRAESRAIQSDFQKSIAGRQRIQVQPRSIAWLCDRMYEVELQLAGLDVAPDVETQRLLTTTQRLMDVYIQEHKKTSITHIANATRVPSAPAGGAG